MPEPTAAVPSNALWGFNPCLCANACAGWPLLWGNLRWTWAGALLATLVGAATEPLIPALLKPLLDNGFTQGDLNLWLVPVFIIGLFFVRGVAQLIAQYALARVANDGMLALRKDLFERVQQAQMGLFSRHSASALSNTVVYEVQNRGRSSWCKPFW